MSRRDAIYRVCLVLSLGEIGVVENWSNGVLE